MYACVITYLYLYSPVSDRLHRNPRRAIGRSCDEITKWNKLNILILTILSPKCRGANSTARTLPLASVSVVRSTQRVPVPVPPEPPDATPPLPLPLPLPVLAIPGAALGVPLTPGPELVCRDEGTSSHIFTVRSNDDEARMGPNSGCAHESFVIAASCAYTLQEGVGKIFVG